MPWCDTCDKHISPEEFDLRVGCETCGNSPDASDMKVGKIDKPPRLFWFMIAALACYLLWRLVHFVLGIF